MSIAWYEIYICNLKWDWTNIKMGQGWEFTHSIIAHLLICLKSLILMSDYDRLIQIAQNKWATVSESLRLLILSFAHKKREIHSKKKFKYNHVFMYVFKKCFANFFLKKRAIRSLPLFWWAMYVNRSDHSWQKSELSKSLRSLTKNEQMSELLIFWANHSFANFFAKKTSDSLRKLMSEFPNLKRGYEKYLRGKEKGIILKRWIGKKGCGWNGE